MVSETSSAWSTCPTSAAGPAATERPASRTQEKTQHSAACVRASSKSAHQLSRAATPQPHVQPRNNTPSRPSSSSTRYRPPAAACQPSVRSLAHSDCCPSTSPRIPTFPTRGPPNVSCAVCRVFDAREMKSCRERHSPVSGTACSSRPSAVGRRPAGRRRRRRRRRTLTPMSSRQLHWPWAALRGRVCACFLVCFAARPGLRGAPE
jgi:hypothetical protein